MTMSAAREYILEVYLAGVSNLNIVGGEPMIFPRQVTRLVRFARALNLDTTVATNAFWAVSRKKAECVVGGLKACGLGSMLISTDSFHQKYINLDNVVNALAAARRHGLRVLVAVVGDCSGPLKMEIDAKFSPFNAKVVYTPVIPLGRASSIIDNLQGSLMPGGCIGFNSISITPGGGVISCCGSPLDIKPPNPLFLGHLGDTSLRRMLNGREGNPLLETLNRLGPIGLYKLQKKSRKVKLKPLGGYINNCQLCHDLIASGHPRPVRAKRH
jgi:hypothetical protein